MKTHNRQIDRELIAAGLAEHHQEQAGRAVIADRAAAAGLDVGAYLRRRTTRRRVRARAAELGLTYWPALFTTGCDPRAFAIAEGVLARQVGARWGEDSPGPAMLGILPGTYKLLGGGSMTVAAARSWGGWDSAGHRGLSAGVVRDMWLAAGARDCPKFRAQVRLGVLAKRGETLPEFLAYARGERWWVRHRCHYSPLYLSRKAIGALGRLSPELRHAALDSLAHPHDPQLLGDRPLRIRDLDWSAVARAQAMLASGAARPRAALALAPRGDFLQDWGGVRRAGQILGLDEPVSELDLRAALAPAYPTVPLYHARLLALGESPATIARRVLTNRMAPGLRSVLEGHAEHTGELAAEIDRVALTRREAHLWMLAGAPGIPEWLSDCLTADTDTPIEHRSLVVIRWLERLHREGRWGTLFVERRAPIPGRAEPHRWRAIDVLDEIHASDIVTGRDSLEAVLERSARRLGTEWLQRMATDHRELTARPAWADKLPRWMQLLNTRAALVAEGRALDHCVGGYAEAVARGECYILSVGTAYGRSTVELRPPLLRTSGLPAAPGRPPQIVQHKGVRNGPAPARNKQLLEAWCARQLRLANAARRRPTEAEARRDPDAFARLVLGDWPADTGVGVDLLLGDRNEHRQAMAAEIERAARQVLGVRNARVRVDHDADLRTLRGELLVTLALPDHDGTRELTANFTRAELERQRDAHGHVVRALLGHARAALGTPDAWREQFRHDPTLRTTYELDGEAIGTPPCQAHSRPLQAINDRRPWAEIPEGALVGIDPGAGDRTGFAVVRRPEVQRCPPTMQVFNGVESGPYTPGRAVHTAEDFVREFAEYPGRPEDEL